MGARSCRAEPVFGIGSAILFYVMVGIIERGVPQAYVRARASSATRCRPKGVFGKGVSNRKNASEMRQKCVKNASKWVFSLGKEECSKIRQNCVKLAPRMRQKCTEHLWGRTVFGRYRATLCSVHALRFFFFSLSLSLSLLLCFSPSLSSLCCVLSLRPDLTHSD